MTSSYRSNIRNNFGINLSIIIILLSLSFSALGQSDTLRLGVFYYPGWKNDVVSNVSPRPWEAIKKFPEREPKLGYYNEGDLPVLEQQIDWMADAGIDFMALDWYWHPKLKVLKSYVIDAYFKAKNKNKISLSIIWCNNAEFPASLEEFDEMVRFWLYYFRRPEFLKINGKPVVFVFSAQILEDSANRYGQSSQTLIARARKIVKDGGFSDIFLVGGAGANSRIVEKLGAHPPYDAYSAYNYHGPGSHRYAGGREVSHTYAELVDGYLDHWNWMLNRSDVPYIVPMTVGWDRRAWGGSADPLHDNSYSTPDEFFAHLKSGKATILANPEKTKGLGVICCWNEFGEGSITEPTKKNGFQYLEQVRRVFAPNKPSLSDDIGETH